MNWYWSKELDEEIARSAELVVWAAIALGTIWATQGWWYALLTYCCVWLVKVLLRTVLDLRDA